MWNNIIACMRTRRRNMLENVRLSERFLRVYGANNSVFEVLEIIYLPYFNTLKKIIVQRGMDRF